ncbi:hypothetical protein [Caldicellulosiruptor morganii]|uniref:Uncharacterized protein n=1 Tax=Caldicellulosiruptor morganii TaxID=1387555 RepID=A0ABY7BR19_9FIRM|nr:hypothetical protein [Caldicellulosiruptor morganii]WAM34903.1 hypothetical protein OTK00_001164 [Caldicellulosiruptor morganii]
MHKITFMGHLFEPQIVLSENPLKKHYNLRLLYHKETLFIATREENSNSKITNLLLYSLEKDKYLHLLSDYKLKTSLDDIIGIDRLKKVVYGLSINYSLSTFSILKIDVLNHIEENLYEIKLPYNSLVELDKFSGQNEFFCQTKILDDRYSIFTLEVQTKSINYRKSKSFLFFFDFLLEKIYDLSYISEKIIRKLNLSKTTLLRGKYILFETGRIGDSEKFDIIFEAIQEKGKNFDHTDFSVKQTMIIYPLEKFLEDISNCNLSFEKYCFEKTDFQAVILTDCRWFENDEYFYIKTFTTENKSELIKVKVSNKGVEKKEIICRLNERIISDSIFVKERILDYGKLIDENLFYVVIVSRISPYCSKISILYIGKCIDKKDYYFEFKEKENVIKINIFENYMITCKMCFDEKDIYTNTDNLHLAYKCYSFPDKQLIYSLDGIHMLYKELIFRNPFDKTETLFYFY